MKGDDIAERLLESLSLYFGSPPRESRYWLNVIQRAKLLDKDLSGLLRDAAELAAILAASAKTARTAFKE